MEKSRISRRKARQRKIKNRIILAGAAAVTVGILVVSLLLWQRNEDAGAGSYIDTQESSISEESITIPVETQAANVSVEGMDVSGLTMEEARKTLQDRYSGILEVKAGEEAVTLENPVDAEITRLLEEVSKQPGIDQELEFDDQRIKQSLTDQTAALAGKWDKKPVNSSVVAFDKASGAYEYSKAQNGQTLAQERLAEELYNRVQAGEYGTPVEAVFSEVPAERTQAQAKALYQVVGTFTTKLTSNKNRNQNVKLAADAINGKILQPGEEFSFNQTTGNRTSEKGYQPAGAYRDGVLIEEPGGGVCQVSTTLYHSIIQSGFKTTERNPHSYAPTYVEGGQDAMVSYDGYAGPDLKFKNSGNAPIVLRASVQGLDLKISIVGISILEDGMTVGIRSEKVRDVEPPEPIYEEDPTLPFGTEQIVEQAKSASVWKSFRVYKKDGAVVKEEPLHNSTYKTKPAKIKRNTTVMTETTAAEETTAPMNPSTGTDHTGAVDSESSTDAGIPAGTEPSADPGSPVTPGTEDGHQQEPPSLPAQESKGLEIPEHPGNEMDSR